MAKKYKKETKPRKERADKGQKRDSYTRSLIASANLGRKAKPEGEKKEPLRLFVTPNSVKEKGGEQHVKQELMKNFESLPKLI
ncbi:MAG: hypothetical protein V4687_16195 [Bacteroidota bacterium]